MQLLPRPSPKATNRALAERDDPVLPAVLEFQSPSTAITAAPMPRAAQGTIWVISSMFAVCLLALGLIKVDRVVTAPGTVVSITPTMVLQPLETSIVRSIDVSEGQSVRAGDVLARLDPTFTAADVGSMAAQVASLHAQVARMQAEVEERPFTYAGLDRDMSLQAAIFAQRQSEYMFKLDGYKQKIDSLIASIARANSDAEGYRNRLTVAQNLEQMRRDLDRLGVGSKLNTLSAMDNRAEMQRFLNNAQETASSGQRDLAALIAERDGYIQSWHADIADKLSDATAKLADSREQLNKAERRRQLVELRADRDATVRSIAKVSEGSVLNPGQQFITLVPADAPLEIEANIPGREDGYVHVGDAVSIKFDTFPFAQYGMAYGTVRTISPDSFVPQDDQRNPTGSVPLASASNDPYYRSRIAIDRVALHDTPANFRIIPGMPVTADVRVGKRTVLAYLLGRIIPITEEGMREP